MTDDHTTSTGQHRNPDSGQYEHDSSHDPSYVWVWVVGVVVVAAIAGASYYFLF